MFILSKTEDESIRLSMKNLKCTAKVKFHHMFLCEMELGYGLALSPDDIVYSNPEFESVLGVLGSNE